MHGVIAVVLQPLHHAVDRERIGPLHGDTCAALGQGVMKSRRDGKVNRSQGGLLQAKKASGTEMNTKHAAIRWEVTRDATAGHNSRDNRLHVSLD
jgi:hypothetical protein